MKTGRKFTVEESQCRSCHKLIYPKIIDGKIQPLPVHCPGCNSQYWNLVYTRADKLKKDGKKNKKTN